MTKVDCGISPTRHTGWPCIARSRASDLTHCSATRSRGGSPASAAHASPRASDSPNATPGRSSREPCFSIVSSATPSHLQWIEVDLPELLAYKAEQLAGETPRCNLERVALDLSNVAARRELFERLGTKAKSVMIVSEGLVVYLAPEEVFALASDLARTPTFNRWALDMVSPAPMRMMLKTMGQELQHAAVRPAAGQRRASPVQSLGRRVSLRKELLTVSSYPSEPHQPAPVPGR